MTLGKYLERNLNTATIDHGSEELLVRMREWGVNYLIVVDGETVVGIVNRGTVEEAMNTETLGSEKTAKQLMSRRLLVIDSKEQLEVAISKMEECCFETAIIIDENQKVVGTLEYDLSPTSVSSRIKPDPSKPRVPVSDRTGEVVTTHGRDEGSRGAGLRVYSDQIRVDFDDVCERS